MKTFLRTWLKHSVVGAAGLIGFGLVAAHAQDTPQPILHLPLDGSLANIGSLPVPPQLITGGNGEPFNGAGNFAEGRIGQSLRLDGTYAVEIPFDLDRGVYPNVTVTAWVWSEPGCDQGQVPILANGGRVWLNLYGHELRIHSGSGPDHTARHRDGAPNGRWVFAAGVYDGDNQTTRLYVDQRQDEATIDMTNKPTDGRSVWIGSYTNIVRSGYGAIRVDDVRVYDRVLNEEEVRNLYIQGLQGIGSDAYSTSSGPPSDSNTEAGTTSTASSSGPLLETPTSISQPTGITAPVGTKADELEEDIAAAQEAASTSEPVYTAPPVFEVTEEIEAVIIPEEDASSEATSAATETAGSSGSSTTRSCPGPDPCWYVDASDFVYTPIAGAEGSVQRQLNLDVFRPLQRIGWGITTFTPCRLKIGDGEGDTIGEAGTPGWDVEAGTCNANNDTFRDASLFNGFITGIQFEKKPTRNAIDSLGVFGYELALNGSIVGVEANHSADPDFGLPLSGGGSMAVECPPSHLASGVIGHFDRRANNATVIVGLQLKCSPLRNAAPWNPPN